MQKDEDAALTRALLALYKETFEGPPEKGGFCLDPGTGLHQTLANIGSDEASKLIKGNSVAAHSRHLDYYLEVLHTYLRGNMQVADWQSAWKKRKVSSAEWIKLRKQIRERSKELEKHFEEIGNWDPDRITLALAIVVHSAYHLASIRQMIKHLK